MSCNFGQFLCNGNLAEEKSVILIIDCYSGRQARVIRKGQEEDKPVNIFTKESDYEYFVEIYQKWKERRERTGGVLEPTENLKASKLRNNDSFSSISSMGQHNAVIPKNRSGFFNRNSSTLDMAANTSFQSD